MTHKLTKIDKKVTLELVGLDGNAFALMGAFQRQARTEKWTPDEIKAVLDECQAGDYDHLLCTLMEHTQSPVKDKDEDFEDYCEGRFNFDE